MCFSRQLRLVILAYGARDPASRHAQPGKITPGAVLLAHFHNHFGNIAQPLARSCIDIPPTKGLLFPFKTCPYI
jgi:hypothetical protein